MKKLKYYCIQTPVFFTLESYPDFINSYLARFALIAPTLLLIYFAFHFRNDKRKLSIYIALSFLSFIVYLIFYLTIPPIPSYETFDC
jgi:hypothetical protein